MLKHLPAGLFGLCMLVIILNTTLDNRPDIFVGALVLGIAAIVLVAYQDRRSKGPKPSREAEIAEWTRERDSMRQSLDSARAEGAQDRVDYFAPKLAEAERMLKKLGTL
jgi:hypothetical protein